MTVTRKAVLAGLGAAIVGGRAVGAARPAGLTRIVDPWVVSEAEAVAWHKAKVEKGPALTGNVSWRNFLDLLEAKLKDCGCVDVHRSPWMFKRLETSVWPDDSKWSLTIGGRRIPLANFGANCGLTGPEGVTAELVLWDPAATPDVAGKVVVFRPVVRPDVRAAFSASDYEAMTPFDSWPVEGVPVPQAQDATHSIAAPVWDEMTQSSAFVRDIQASKPAGVIFAMNLNRAATAGLYTFPVPEHYGFPSVYVDRTTGDGVIGEIGDGRQATLRVEGRHVDSEAYQLVACLPGRAYGTAADEQIQLRTHTDGPSISQDDGAFGLLGVVKYLSHVPQAERPRTLLIELDCRHFMPGAERAWAAQDYFEKRPHARDKVVAMIAMEHLGQIDYVADGEDIRPSGRSLPTWIYATGNPAVIDEAVKAARDNQVRSAIVRSPGRPGVHGRSQGPWYGMGSGAQRLGIPGYGVQGDLGAYWAHSAGIERFDARSFRRQVAAFAQLTGFLMTSDLSRLQAPKIDTAPGAALRR
ncbi:MAG: hypothetical protein GC203_15605 [Phenylobacterium sp.]|uniref:hypothetical protein n=1 Tax=Phenylobacterium sp. TaxID=1871053 RepID=UPI0025CCE9BF|nr:hypothetical protein [Phenylobacterium sp.]MBI1199286.1 hypothetical protein [Phenylobacterium sp.]